MVNCLSEKIVLDVLLFHEFLPSELFSLLMGSCKTFLFVDEVFVSFYGEKERESNEK